MPEFGGVKTRVAGPSGEHLAAKSLDARSSQLRAGDQEPPRDASLGETPSTWATAGNTSPSPSFDPRVLARVSGWRSRVARAVGAHRSARWIALGSAAALSLGFAVSGFASAGDLAEPAACASLAPMRSLGDAVQVAGGAGYSAGGEEGPAQAPLSPGIARLASAASGEAADPASRSVHELRTDDGAAISAGQRRSEPGQKRRRHGASRPSVDER